MFGMDRPMSRRIRLARFVIHFPHHAPPQIQRVQNNVPAKPRRAGFICLEPWHGIADPEGFSADFTEKPGVFIVPSGAALPMKMSIELLPG